MFLFSSFPLKILSILYLCLSGKDLPSNAISQVYPQDRVVPVGASTNFCCIVMEGKHFGFISSAPGNMVEKTTRLSRRTYSVVVVNQKPSVPSGINVICYGYPKEFLNGSSMFAGCKTIGISKKTNAILVVISKSLLNMYNLTRFHI